MSCTPHQTFFSGNNIKAYEMSGAQDTYGGKRNACGVLVGKPEGQRPLRRPTSRLDNTQMHKKNTTELLAQDRNSTCCEHGYERLGSIKYWELLH